MNQEIKEILEYLKTRQDYVIWAGFCVFAHLGIEYSPDVDIYTDSKKTKKKISAEFQKRKWKSIPHKEVGYGWDWDQLKKNKTTFDIIYTPASSRLLLPDTVEIEVYGCKLRFLSKEGLFLTKLGQLSWLGRKRDKRRRDIEIVNSLRNSIDPKKLNKLASNLPSSYWLAGQI